MSYISKQHHPVAIANYFIDRNQKEKVDLTLLKLVKLVYMACGWQLAQNGMPLIDEAVEAWQYGPVVPSVYHTFKDVGKQQITDFGEIYDTEEEAFVVPIIDQSDKELCGLLDQVWEKYKNFSAIELSKATHEKGSAWSQVVENAKSKLLRNTHIPDNLIKNEFIRVLDLHGHK